MAYEEARDWFGYGKACNELMEFLIDRFEIEQDWSNRREILREGLSYGEKAIANFLELGDDYELTRAYQLTSLLYCWAAYYGELEKRKKLGEKSVTYSERSLELSKKVGDGYLIAISNLAAVHNQFWIMGDLKLSLKRSEKVLQQGLKMMDNLLIGQAFSWLAGITYWMPWTEEDPDKKRKMYKKILEHTNQAAFYLDIISSYAFVGETHWVYVESLAEMAREVETDRKEKRVLLERAVKDRRKAVENANQSGHPESMAYLAKSLSKALYFLSSIETKTGERQTLLEEALEHAVKNLEIAEQSFPLWYWYRGVAQNYQALILAELARIETEDKKKTELLEKAVLNMERCIKFCTKWIEFYPQTELFGALGRYHDWFGRILNQLYQLTGEPRSLQKMIEIYQGALETYNKAGMPSRLAETYWQIAKVKDRLGEHLEAAENFEFASERYKASAEKMPHLKEFYIDYVLYMQAWSEIEKARHCHARKEYGQANKHYEKAASLHGSSESWKYLASNYLAWAQLERGEDLSRDEQSQEAIQTFQKATELFREGKRTLRVELERIESADEKDLVKKLIKASDTREKYCFGRIRLEEAKTLDRQGDHVASSKKYGSAAETFQEIAKAVPEQTRKELQPLIYLSKAWQKMMMAEVKASPPIYGEAAELFKQAKEHTFDQQTSLLSLANSSFCKALEAGTRFEDTSDTTTYSAATQHLETAANYYVKAGFKTASEYAKATQRLFDAYVYMNNAKKETDPEKKAKYYMMAEKVLRISASSYQAAKHHHASQEVQRFLEKVKEERKLAVSLSEVLHAPTITSSTASFVTLTPSEEMAVGLEKFERADVQAKLIQHEKEIRVGEDFNLEMQIVNVGKEPVLLAKVEKILPVGFQLVAKPDYCYLEDAYLDLKGKRLDPLKTDEIRLVLRSFGKGTFEIKPRIVCVDENGNQILCEPEPVTTKVLEVILPSRITTGYADLDKLLFGGLPENYAVILTSPSCDERDLLIQSFLEEGVKEGQVTFYITTEASGVRAFVEEFPSNFSLFICNPQADTMIKSLPNVFKLSGVENLTDIGIALIKAFRRLDESTSGPRRVCIEIISDVLLERHVGQTRRWLSDLIPDLRSRGFTILAVMNPQMHPLEEVHAILGLFQGEISIYEKETKKGLKKFLKIKKMYNQKYLESELSLRKERLET